MRAAADQSHPSGKEGFTLVEVIVGMTLMAMIFTAAFGSYFLGMRIIEDAREEIRASQIIQSELERLRTKNWLQISTMPPTAEFEPQGTFIKQYAKDYKAYRYVLDLVANQQKLVVVAVEWKNSRGTTSTQLFNTIITRDGLNDYYYRDL